MANPKHCCWWGKHKGFFAKGDCNMAKLTPTKLKQLLNKHFSGVLTNGKYKPDGQVCVRELRAVALELPWSDHPDGDVASPTDRACQVLNDAKWSSDESRTKHCLPLELLSEATAPKGLIENYVIRTIQKILPVVLEIIANKYPIHKDRLLEVVGDCRKATDLRSAANAADAANAVADAANAVADAANAAAYAAHAAASAANAADAAANAAAYAVHAANAAAYTAVADAANAADAAACAADAANGDKILILAVKILIECASPNKG